MPGALSGYLAQTQSLLDDPGAVEYPTADLTAYINDARVQIAGASESLRALGELTLAADTQAYAFTSIALAPSQPSTAGLAGVIDVRMAAVVGGNQVTVRPWEWFFSYYVAVPAAATGVPRVAATYMPGINGSLWLNPIPTAVATLLVDGVWYPIPLVDDTTIEALQYPWTEAVQYYAAYLAYLNAQRRTDADAMFARYQVFETRATQMTTPTRLPRQYPGRGAREAAHNMPITAPMPSGQGGP